jgi:XTP/dITP diphosphohydrolase
VTSIVLATSNQGKIRELAALLKNFDLDVKGLKDFPEIGPIEETGQTFLENARIKARAVSQALNMAAIADDSGLAVDALNGAPGVHSARYSGPGATDASNNAKLLQDLSRVPEDKRTARFVCSMVAMAPSGASIEAEGKWEGRIASELCGDGGFGYDPLFFLPEKNMTSAQLSREEKNRLSHRGQALRRLLELWPGFQKQLKG